MPGLLGHTQNLGASRRKAGGRSVRPALSDATMRAPVPPKSLFDHLEAGDSIEQFLEGFLSVKRELVMELLEESRAV